MAQVYRLYENGKKEDFNYVLSIVASDTDATYVVPVQTPELFEIFNDERLTSALGDDPVEEYPKTEREWALLAAYNSGFSLHPVEGDASEDVDMLIEDEQEYANEIVEKYSYMREVQ